MGKYDIEKAYKLSEESAVEIVKNMCLFYDVDVDYAQDEDKGQAEAGLDIIMGFVRRGLIEFREDDGVIVQNLQSPPGDVITIDYRRLTGKQIVDIEKRGRAGQAYSQTFLQLGAASGLGEAAFNSFSGIDLKVASAVALFLG